jgi:hypothetical protein
VCRSLGERGLVLIYEGLRTKVKARAVAQVGYAKPLVDRACETARTGAALLFTAAIDDSCRANGCLLPGDSHACLWPCGAAGRC